jgi:oxygen-dependent protoporphyrinogen oxidase
MHRVIIVGGGISGLTTGWELLYRGLPPEHLLVLEADSRPGGNIRTNGVEEFLVEEGPNGFLDNSPPTLDLVRRLGIENRLLPSRESASLRFIFRNGRLHSVPMSPPALLGSGLLSVPGKLRIFLEPFIPKGGTPQESVFDFAARRIGKESATILVDSMVSGVFAGDARNLELRAAFPRMADLEARYGGLVKAMLALRREKKASGGGGPAGPGGRLTSFRDGMEELPRVLSSRLGTSLRTEARVERVTKASDCGYQVELEGGEKIEAETVVLACPSSVASSLTQGMNPKLASELGEIPAASIAVVANAYRPEDLDEIPWGFGFLVPRTEGVRILGSLWTSSIWEHRSPENRVLLRTMVGGAHDPAAVDLDDETLRAIVAQGLEETMGLKARPVLSWIYRYSRGIAQYPPGHTARRARIEEILQSYPGLLVSGSSYGGISVNHCVAEAPQIADRVMATLQDS